MRSADGSHPGRSCRPCSARGSPRSAATPELADEITAGRRVGLVVPASLDAIGADGTLDGDVQLIDADLDGLALAVTPGVAAIVDVSSLDDV